MGLAWRTGNTRLILAPNKLACMWDRSSGGTVNNIDYNWSTGIPPEPSRQDLTGKNRSALGELQNWVRKVPVKPPLATQFIATTVSVRLGHPVGMSQPIPHNFGMESRRLVGSGKPFWL
jgi:hypothetical protein